MNIVQGLKYSNGHEWVRVEGNQATIGVTDFAQSQLGDVVFVELPEDDIIVRAGDGFSVIESVKAVSDIYAPVSGKIVKVTIELTDISELDDLMDADAYERFVAEGGH
ncbi:MAG: Glycine cleavage system protein [Firmicutes bacterium]|nr:Glycine cleavage system protein [Bacillota bacterium]